MGEVLIHCYGCDKTVAVEEGAMARGLQAARWSFETGQTFCPSCTSSQNPSAPSAPSTDSSAVDLGQAMGLRADSSANALERFPGGAVSRERGVGRALRLMRSSLSVLREDPQLLLFPVLAMLANLAVGAVWFALSISAGGGGRHLSRGTWLLTSLIAAYPI